jgi:outer membrane protein
MGQVTKDVERPYLRGHEMFRNMKIATLLALFGALFPCPMSHAPCPTAWAAEWKVGYVNVAKVFDGYERTKASDATLGKKGKQKEAELEERMNELKKLRQNLELLNDEARETKTREIEEKAEELQQFRTSTARDLSRERDKIAKEILQEIQGGLEEYAKANHFSLILDSRSLLYGQSAHDVTDEVLKLLNSRKREPLTP